MNTFYNKRKKVLDETRRDFFKVHGTVLSIGKYLDLQIILKEKERDLKNSSIEF